jgi:replicative DNA helicase
MDVELEILPALTDVASLRLLYEEGVSGELFFDQEVRAIVVWSMDYFYKHGNLNLAPSYELMDAAFPSDVASGHLGYVAMLGKVSGGVATTFIVSELKNKYAKERLRDAITEATTSSRLDPVGAATTLQTDVSSVIAQTRKRSETGTYSDEEYIRLHEKKYEEEYRDRERFVIPWFIPELTELTDGGIRLKEMVPVVGSPGTGKTWFACAEALAAAQAGKNVFFATLELSVTEIMMRMDIIAARDFSFRDYRKGTLPYPDVQKIYAAHREIMKYPGKIRIEYLTQEDSSVDGIYARVRREPCDLVIIDQLQFIRRADSYRNRTEAIENVIGDLKIQNSSMRDDKALMLMVQFNREVKDTKDGIGVMQDIALSASIEQVADYILAIGQTPEMHRTDSMALKTLKTRNFSPFKIGLRWQLDHGVRFEYAGEVAE